MQGTTHPRNETLLPSGCLIPLRITHYLVWNPNYALLPHSTQFSFHLEAKIVNKQTNIHFYGMDNLQLSINTVFVPYTDTSMH